MSCDVIDGIKSAVDVISGNHAYLALYIIFTVLSIQVVLLPWIRYVCSFWILPRYSLPWDIRSKLDFLGKSSSLKILRKFVDNPDKYYEQIKNSGPCPPKVFWLQLSLRERRSLAKLQAMGIIIDYGVWGCPWSGGRAYKLIC